MPEQQQFLREMYQVSETLRFRYLPQPTTISSFWQYINRMITWEGCIAIVSLTGYFQLRSGVGVTNGRRNTEREIKMNK